MTAHTWARVARSGSSSPSTWPRNSTPAPPSAAEAACCSDRRCATSSIDVRRRIPGPLGAVGQHEVVHGAPLAGPLGQRGTGLELGIVGVGDDHQRARRHGQVDRRGRGRPRCSRHGSGQCARGVPACPGRPARRCPTPGPRRAPRATRSPSRAASAQCRSERIGAVGELERGGGRDRHDVAATAPAVGGDQDLRRVRRR